MLRCQKRQMHVAARMVVVRHRRGVASRGGVKRRVAVRRRRSVLVIDVLMIVAVIVVSRGHFGIVDAGELKRVLDAVLRIADAIGLQRDHDGHGHKGAELAKESRQENSPITAP